LLKKRRLKRSFLKYFKSFEIDVSINENSVDDISDSFGYFVYSKKSEVKFLNRFTIEDIMVIMKRTGLVKHLHNRGFENIIPIIDRDEALVHYLKIYGNDTLPDNLLIDLRLSETRFIPDERFFEKDSVLNTLDMIVIEWLTLQNPRTGFTDTKPQLPGQRNPGLGALRFMMDIMFNIGRGVIKDGFLDIPEHIHGAIMYSSKFKFFNPAHEAILRAILRDLKNYSLLDISWGVTTDTIIDATTDKPQEYKSSEQIFPVSKRLQDYFNSKKYNEEFKGVYREKRYWLDFEEMIKRRSEILKAKSIVDI
jgi:hypothetical protein